MSEERCERSDLLVSACAHRRGFEKTEEFEYIVTHRMIAKYAGTCTGCGEHFVPGETTIGATENGWVGEECFR